MKTGRCYGLCACLLTGVAGASSAQTGAGTLPPTPMPPNAGPNPKGQGSPPSAGAPGGLKTTLAVSYVIDRSPMATSAESQRTEYDHLLAEVATKVQIAGVSGFPQVAGFPFLKAVEAQGVAPDSFNTDAVVARFSKFLKSEEASGDIEAKIIYRLLFGPPLLLATGPSERWNLNGLPMAERQVFPPCSNLTIDFYTKWKRRKKGARDCEPPPGLFRKRRSSSE